MPVTQTAYYICRFSGPTACMEGKLVRLETFFIWAFKLKHRTFSTFGYVLKEERNYRKSTEKIIALLVVFLNSHGQILRSMGSRIKIQLVIPIAFSPGGPHLFCVHRLNCFRSSFAVNTDICVAKYIACDIEAMSYFLSSMIVNTADMFSRMSCDLLVMILVASTEAHTQKLLFSP